MYHNDKHRKLAASLYAEIIGSFTLYHRKGGENYEMQIDYVGRGFVVS